MVWVANGAFECFECFRMQYNMRRLLKKQQLKEHQENKINHHKNKLYINMGHHQLEDQVIIYIIMVHQ